MSKAFLDVLHARQPKLDYLSPAICEYIFSGSGFSSFLLEEGWNDDPVSSATMVVYGIGGDHALDWDPVVGAICYMVYVADDPDNPLTSTYTLIADCIDRPYNPPPPPPTCVGCPPPRPPCYTIQALTDAGLSPLSVPICPNPPPPSCPQCGGGGGSGELTCFTEPGNVHAFLNNPFSWTPTLVTPGAGTFSISAGTLPPGLVLHSATGRVSGLPTVGGSYPLHLRFTYTGGAFGCTQAFTFIVSECITTSGALPDAYIDAPYTLDLAASEPGGTFAIANGSLPLGFTLAADGELSGIAEETGDFTFTVGYTLGADFCIKDFTVHVGAACISTDGPLDTGIENEAYSQTLIASVPEAGQEWTITSGFLPPSLTLDLNTGEISGTPDLGTAGEYAVTVRLTNTDLTFCEENFSITILENDVTCITNNAVLAGGQEEQPYLVALTAATPEGGQVWSIADGALPPGLTLDPDTGDIAGTPEADSADLYFFVVRLTNLDTSFCEKEFEIAVLPAEGECINMPGFNILPNAEEGVAYSETLIAAAPEVGQVWSVVGGAFPAGISLTGAVISGTPDPATAGLYFITIRLTNLDTTYCEVTFQLTVTTSDCITTGAILSGGQEGVAYSQMLVAANPEAGQLWTVSVGAVPSGLSLIAATGAITGTPDTGDPGSAGVHNFTVRLTNLDTSFCEKAFTLTIAEQDIQNCPDFSQQGALNIVEELGFGYSITPPSGGPGASKSVALTSVGSTTGSVDWVSPYDFSTDENCDCQVQIQIAPTGEEATGYVFIYRNNVFVTGAVANDTDGSIDVTMPFTVPAGNHSLEVRVGAFISTGGPATSTTITYSLSIV